MFYGRPSNVEVTACALYEIISCSDVDCEQTYLDLMMEAHTSTTGVRKALAWLEARGWLVIKRRRGQLNEYIPLKRIDHYQPELLQVNP